MNKVKKIISLLAITTLTLTFPFSSNIRAKGSEVASSESDFRWTSSDETSKICDYDGTEISKTVSQTPDKDGNYEITLNVKGKPKNIVEPIDVIFVKDVSNSMSPSQMDSLQKAMNDFVENVVKKDKTRIALVSFGDYAEITVPLDYKSEVENKNTNNYINNLKQKMDLTYEDRLAISTTMGTSTNMIKAWSKVEEILSKDKNKNSKKFVVFFTDGLPNDGGSKEESIRKTLTEYNNVKNDNPGLGIYSIGLIDNIMGETDKKDAKLLLSQMNNKGFYAIDSSSGNSDSLDMAYKEIADNVIQDKDMAKGLTITDTVPNDFEIVKKVYDDKNSEIITNKNNEKISFDGSINGNTISWNRGENTIDSIDGIQIKFKIRPKNDYWGSGTSNGEDLTRVPTNEIATISYTKPNESNKKITGEFNIPTVSIPYKKGSISVSKNLVNENGENISSYNKDFTICLDGGDKGKYYLKVKANGQVKTMKFYMRYKETDISNNKDASMNYLSVGDYTIKELDSLNYDTKSIKINGKNVSLDGVKFIVDKDNPNIKIEITNVEKNNTGFDDEKSKENSFGTLNLGNEIK